MFLFYAFNCIIAQNIILYNRYVFVLSLLNSYKTK
jgi:hypothetical protein